MTNYIEPIRAQQSWREHAESPYESLAGLMAGVPHLSGARCRGLSALFDVEDAADPRAEQAVELCRGCPALKSCGDWVASLPPKHRPAGVVAGQLPPSPPGKRVPVRSRAKKQNGRHRATQAEEAL